MKKGFQIAQVVILTIILLSAYPIYALVMYNLSKSPDDFSLFPKSGVWVCETENFTMTINLDREENEEVASNAINAKSITLTFDGSTYNLNCYGSHGHGTILAPVAPSKIINFELSGDLQEDFYKTSNVDFSVSKYKFNENDFYFLNIYLRKNHKLKYITGDMTLHFIKK